MIEDYLCGLVVRVPGYRTRGLGLIPGATRFSEKWWVLEQGPLSLVSTIEEEIVAATAVGDLPC
jgi:hypothetical protein